MDPVAYEPETGNAFQRQLLELALNPLGVFRRRWIWITLTLIVGLSVTAALVATWVPSYKATASVLVSSQQIPENFVKSTVRDLDTLSNVNALLGEVLSNRNLSELIKENDLYANTATDQPDVDLVATMRRNITITPQRNINQERPQESTAIFIISYEGETPQQVASVANSLASILIDVSLDKRSEQARKTTDFLRQELVRAEGDLAAVNHEITEFNQTYRGELPGDLQPLLQKLERLQQQRKSLSDQITAAEDRLVTLQSAKTSTASEEMVLELRAELSNEIAIHTEEHPNVIALRRRIDRLVADMQEGPVVQRDPDAVRVTQIESTQREIDKLRSSLAETEATLSEIDARVDRVPRRAEQYAALEQRAGVLREGYLEFMRKVKDAELAETLESAQQGPQVSMLDRAQPPSAPTQSPLMYLLPGVIGAFGMALVVGFGLELIDPVMLSQGHLEAVGAPPVLGSVYRLAD